MYSLTVASIILVISSGLLCDVITNLSAVVRDREGTSEVINITSLKQLDGQISLTIRRNKLPKLTPDTFKGLYFLEELDLKDNQIEEIDRNAFENMTSLGQLHLEDNKLTGVRNETFRGLTSLKDLVLSLNKITKVKRGIFNGLKIDKLYLSNNPIVEIEDGSFDDMTELTALIMDSTLIDTISPEWYHNVPKLWFLNFAFSRIKTIPEAAFKNLEPNALDIYLSANGMEEIHPQAFKDVNNVQGLQMAYNSIENLDEDLFKNVGSVGEIDFSSNKFKCLSEKFLGNLRGLKKLSLSGNPLEKSCKERITNWTNIHGIAFYH